MTLTELIPVEELIELERELNERFQVNAAVFDADGKRVTDFVNWGNPLCPVIKKNPASLSAICAVAAKSFASRIESTGKCVADVCDAGLFKLSAPIVVNGEFLGQAGGCGLLPEDGEVEEFFVHKSTGESENRVAELAGGIPVASEATCKEFEDYVIRRIEELTAGRA